MSFRPVPLPFPADAAEIATSRRRQRSLRGLVPGLLACALLAGGGAGQRVQGASAEQRDEHFQAITAVLDKDFLLTGERERAAFAALGYPDDALHRVALEWYAALKIRGQTKDPARVAALDKTAAGLRTQLDAADDANKLPEAVLRLLSTAGSQTSQLLRDLSGFMAPDEPAPKVPRAPERIEIAKRQVTALIEAAGKEWKRSLAKVKAAQALADEALQGDDKDPKVKDAIYRAGMLRFDAVKVIYNAHTALREVVTRGADFGLDPKPAAAFLTAFLKENAPTIADWEYTFGDYFPFLKMYADAVLLECARQKTPNQRLDDLETSMQGVTSLDLRGYPAGEREGLLQLQIQAWTALLRTRLELALAETDTAKRTAQADKGLEHFATFRDIYKGQKDMTPMAANQSRAWFLGALWITAARLAQAKADAAQANGLLGEVAGNKATNASVLAGGWLASGTAVGGGDAWGKPTIPGDPGQAITLAQALLKEANATTDAKLKRAQVLSAAVALRGGVAGIESAFADQFVEVGPELYGTYAIVLSQLELRYHAALVAEEGLRSIAGRVTKDSNPWKKDKEWTASGRQVQKLLKNAQAFAGNLASRAKGAGVAGLQSDVIELVKRISPEDAGQGADEQLFFNALTDGEFERAIQLANDYLTKYPQQQPKVYSWLIAAYSGWYDAAKKDGNEAKAKQVAADMQVAAGRMETEASAALAKKPDAERTKDWLRVLSTVQAAKLTVLLADRKFTEVLTTFGPGFWKNPPADENLRARVLRGLTTAVRDAETARVADEKQRNDPQSLITAFTAYDAAYGSFIKYLPSIKDPGERDKTQRFGKNMVNAFNSVAGLADGLAKTANAPAQLPDIAKRSRQALADLLEPTITEKDKPATILFCANTLWDLDQHERALRLYELYQKVIQADKGLADFLAAPAPILDQVGTSIGNRPEVANDWAKVRDLVEDKPGLKDLIAQGVPESEWHEKRADFAAALEALRAFRGKAEQQVKTKLGDGWAAADAAMVRLDTVLRSAAQQIVIKAQLARGYRESGKSDRARDLFSELYAYDPTDPSFAAAYVDIVLDQIKGGKDVKKDAEKARDIAKGIRNDAGKNLDLYWQASIQVAELSLALGDGKTVTEALRFNAVNQSGPSFDLVLPRVLPDERQTGDDKRVRRARNALAVELVKRYLTLYQGNGISEKPSTRIDVVKAPDGREWTLFVPLDAPAFEARTVTDQDDGEIVIFVEQGQTGVKPPAAAPAETPAAAAPAATAPTEAKP